ncbi:protein kinase [Streptomyces sp. NPDC000345]|uniref:protein kinase n=1 Tax=Streptomyces sp. NPDC000345 TaxID=3364537 RepID=UPI00368CC2CC
MDDYAGRVLADRYRLPLPPSDEYELTETRAFDTYSGQEVLVRQVPLPEVVEAEVLDADGLPEGFTARERRGAGRVSGARAAASTRRPADPVVRRAVEAAQAAASIPDHPRLDQVFDVFAEGGSLWIVSELVAARPLAALLAEQPLTPYRAAEVASDVLMALRVLHAHGWVHRNITARTVLVCDDGRVMLTGLAVGAAEEALCGYDPVPPQDTEPGTPGAPPDPHRPTAPGAVPGPGPGPAAGGRALGPAPGAAGRGPGPGAAGRGSDAGVLGSGTGGLVPGSGGSAHGPGAGGYDSGVAGRGPGVGGQGPAAGGPGPGVGGYGPGAVGPGSGAVGQGVGVVGDGPGAGGHGPGAGGHGPGQGGQGRGVVGAGPGAGGHGPGAGGHGPGAGGHGAGGGGVGGSGGVDPEAARRAAIEARAAGGLPGEPVGAGGASGAGADGAAVETGGDIRAARAGAIAAYRAGARAAARVQEAQQNGRAALPGTRTPAENANGAVTASPYGAPGSGAVDPPSAAAGRIADPYGVRGAPAPSPAAGSVPLPSGGVPHPPVPLPVQAGADPGDGRAPARWDDLVAAGVPGAPVRRGPATAPAAERARQARMAVVGPVTERWAPEQAGPVHENWQLAAPIGPATDLWALGALLFRAVQGHAPYPEESTAELVQMVCAEPPAFAEECGPLRPVVESLLRQDPTERLGFEELRGWLRSLVRSAPEPEAGTYVVAAPPVDPHRLPIVRRKGELVRRRRAGLPATHGRHKRARQDTGRSPRSLGRVLLVLILLLLAGAVAYAMLFMPKAGEQDAAAGTGGDRQPGATASATAPAGQAPEASSEPRPDQTSPGATTGAETTGTQTGSGADAADGFTVREDAAGFRVAVANGWDRTGKNGRGQVVYSHGDFELIVVPGRDSASANGSDPMVYQREKEAELQPYRDSSWATASGLRTTTVGARTMAEGQFTWSDGGRELYVRNMAVLIDGRYHIVQVRGPEAERDEVTRLYGQAAATYQYTG